MLLLVLHFVWNHTVAFASLTIRVERFFGWIISYAELANDNGVIVTGAAATTTLKNTFTIFDTFYALIAINVHDGEAARLQKIASILFWIFS